MDGYVKLVLVVEEDHPARDILALILEEAGYHIHIARNAMEAFDEMQRRRVEVVVIDYHLPRFNGLEFMTISRFVWPRTPVVLVSGNQPQRSDLAAQRGARAWVPKPYDRVLLLRTIHATAQQSVEA